MNFSEGFTWEIQKNKKKRPIKKFMLKDLIGKDITAKGSVKSCVITPLVPQTHYVGVGSAEGSKFSPTRTKNDNIIPEPCPIISVLSKFPTDIVSSVDKQDEIIKFCQNVSNKYPFENESQCLTKENNDVCSYLDAETKKKFPSLCSKNTFGEALWKKMEAKPAFCNSL